MKYLLLIFFLTNLFFVQAQSCQMLKDGKYSIEYDSVFKNYPKHKFEIKGNQYSTFENDVNKNFEIIKINDCSFRLKNDEIIDNQNLQICKKC